jgi:hypothetical protein|tara:strand:- start:1053 stop:1247 length:195 start_codon:yes stop_codon:yes gene_type:complete
MLLEEVLNMAQSTVDIQYDPDLADTMQILLSEVAGLFDIQISNVTESGQVVPIKGPPSLSIVED